MAPMKMWLSQRKSLIFRGVAPEHIVLAFACLVIAGIWSVVFWKVADDRREVYSAAQAELLGAQNLIAAQFARSTDVSISLMTAIDSWIAGQRRPFSSATDLAELGELIERSIRHQSFPVRARLFDANGERIDLPTNAEESFNIADRPYIKELEGKDADFIVIGQQVRFRGSDDPAPRILPVAKRAHENIFGVRYIVTGILSSELDKLFDRIFVSAPGNIGAFRDDGYLIYRYPDPDNFVGVNLDLDYFMGPEAGRTDLGIIAGRSDPTGRALLIAYKRVDRLPIYVYASFRVADLDARALARRPVYFGFAAVATLPCVGLGVFVMVFARIREREAALLHRALVDSQAANVAKRDFLANVSHELRTPLNAIIGFSEMMGTGVFGALTKKNAEYNADVLKAGNHLLSVVDQLLDIASIEAGQSKLNPGTFNPSATIREVVEILAPRITDRKVSFELLPPALVFTVHSDQRIVRQILLNLADNAMKYSGRPGLVRIGWSVRSDGFWEFFVADNGQGIPESDLPHIFEPFWRSAGAYTAKAEGKGLGLMLTKQMVSQLRGTIDLESTVGSGTRFTVVLPTKLADG